MSSKRISKGAKRAVLSPKAGGLANLVGELRDQVEARRLEAASQLKSAHRSALGQFMTPWPVAEFMARMLSVRHRTIRLLDPGAGIGSLTAALVSLLSIRRSPPDRIEVTAYEIEPRLADGLMRTLETCRRVCAEASIEFAADVRKIDFIEELTREATPLFRAKLNAFNCVVMNPPYRKVNGHSATRRQLRQVGIETTNLYSAFMLLAARTLEPGGEFLSISPRSFCNGPYFRPFRKEFLDLVTLHRIHVFDSRTAAFRDDQVLQENLIVYGRRGTRTRPLVTVSRTTSDGRVLKRSVPPDLVVQPGDPDAVIHVLSHENADDVAATMAKFTTSLADLGLTVSTGRVVDFRAREYLSQRQAAHTVPLIFSSHFRGGRVEWPNGKSRKPNAILKLPKTEVLLVPAGFYVLVKRFSAKEERRRVVAAVYDPTRIAADQVGFDNKTNYFHRGGGGLSPASAHGLAVFLNSTLVDQYFRLFSGHTQVNAADLRRLPYPTRQQLSRLAEACTNLASQEAIDTAMASIL